MGEIKRRHGKEGNKALGYVEVMRQEDSKERRDGEKNGRLGKRKIRERQEVRQKDVKKRMKLMRNE